MDTNHATEVLNLATGEHINYSLPARDAVIAAYAQYGRRDWNTWNYERNYGALPRLINGRTWNLGDFCAPEPHR